MYQLTNYSDCNFALEIANKINKEHKNVASVDEQTLTKPSFIKTSMTMHRIIPTGTKVSACFIDDKYWEECKEYAKDKCKNKPSPLTK